MISHNAFGLDEDLVDHRVTMVTVHFVDAVLVKLGQREEHLQGQSLGLLTVTQLHCLETSKAPGEGRKRKNKGPTHTQNRATCMKVNNVGLRIHLNVLLLFYNIIPH